jgi:hypothetical protein
MTSTVGRADQALSAKRAVNDVIEKQPRDASLDEIVEALWLWSAGTLEGAAASSAAASRMLAVNPAGLVMAGRAARDAVILGLSRQIALDVVHALPGQASLDDVQAAVATWHWPDDSVD